MSFMKKSINFVGALLVLLGINDDLEEIRFAVRWRLREEW
jgi:hypothetical protein